MHLKICFWRHSLRFFWQMQTNSCNSLGIFWLLLLSDLWCSLAGYSGFYLSPGKSNRKFLRCDENERERERYLFSASYSEADLVTCVREVWAICAIRTFRGSRFKRVIYSDGPSIFKVSGCLTRACFLYRISALTKHLDLSGILTCD